MQQTTNVQRSARPRPASHHGPPPAQQSATKKIFNCIVEDTALIAGVKNSTRNGIRQWVKNGQIRLFVPLYALEQLSRQKDGEGRYGQDVRDTIEWLDHATSKYPQIVTLQGAEETYEKWSQVEAFAVPRSLFSESDHIDAEDDHHGSALENDTKNKLSTSSHNQKGSVSSMATATSGSLSPSSSRSERSNSSPISPPSSPAKALLPPTAGHRSDKAQASEDGGVPVRLQPLFNYILWRIHQELDPVAALETFIFLCNDEYKVHAAKGFDVRCKRLEQLRDAIGREEKDVRNRLSVLSKEGQSASAKASTDVANGNDETTTKSPPSAPAAMLSPQTKVLDPDAFSRSPQPTKAAVGNQQSPAFAYVAQDQANPFQTSGRERNRGNFRGSPRGRGGRGGRNGFVNNTTPARGNFSPSSARRGAPVGGQIDTQIDPNSFERPRGGFAGRRAGRKLWVPT